MTSPSSAAQRLQRLTDTVLDMCVTSLAETYEFDYEEARRSLVTTGTISRIAEATQPQRRGPKPKNGKSLEALREECKAARIPFSGSRAALEQRLQDFSNGTIAARQETREELAAKCAEKRLAVSGKREDLIERLRAFEAGEIEAKPLTSAEMRKELKANGWNIGGTKTELIERYQQMKNGATSPAAQRGPTQKDLQDRCRELGLQTSGNKTVLGERLEAHAKASQSRALVTSHMSAVMASAHATSPAAAGAITKTGFTFKAPKAVAMTIVAPSAEDLAKAAAEKAAAEKAAAAQKAAAQKAAAD